MEPVGRVNVSCSIPTDHPCFPHANNGYPPFETAFRSASSCHAAAEANATIQRHLTPTHKLIAHYQSRSENKELTLEKDLHRLQYTLYTHDDKKITELEQIVDYEREHRSQATTMVNLRARLSKTRIGYRFLT